MNEGTTMSVTYC